MVEASGLSFHQPQWLWAAVAAMPVAALLWHFESKRKRLAERFVSERLRGSSNRWRWLRPLILGAAFVSAALALAGPRVGYETVEIPQSDASRILVLDVSDSMSAEDVGTSRLAAAKALARRAIELHDGRAALVIFEGEAEVLSPLTSDVAAVATLLDSVAAGEIGVPGSNLDGALAAALEVMDSAGSRTDIVLVSDGEQQGSSSLQSLATVEARGVAVHAIVVGTEEGGRIPLGRPGEFLRDEAGSEVVSRADSRRMEEIAQRSGGSLLVNPFGERSLQPISAFTTDGEGSGRSTARVPIERYQWPLGAALLFLVLGSLAHRGAE